MITDDKYYTPISLANHCIDMAIETIGMENIKFVIEPSCGAGAFFHHSVLKINEGIDIKPEYQPPDETRIFTRDFLTYYRPYSKGTLIIGNPPFGQSGLMARQFYKKAARIGDYIAFILPISQKDNNSFYEFDLIRSEDLGIQEYSGHKLHCCFNIYKRPPGGIHKRPSAKENEYISICRQDNKHYNEFAYDFRMCAWGANAGKILADDENCCATYKIKVKTKKKEKGKTPEQIEEYRNAQINLIKSIITGYDWSSYPSISSKSISQIFIYNLLNITMAKENGAIVTQIVNEANQKKSSKKPGKNDLEKRYNEFNIKLTSYTDFNKQYLNKDVREETLVPDQIYHAHDTTVPILIIKENRRTIQRAYKMLMACSSCGMTTPAILVRASIVSAWGLTLLDPITMQPATPEQIENSYSIMEGHGRHYGWLLGFAMNNTEPFDFKFVYNDYSSPEEFGEAYISTNRDMTRTTNKDQLGIAEGRSNNPMVKLCSQRIHEDCNIAKAAYFWTYGKELSPSELAKIIKGEADAPQFDQKLADARTKVYEAFKARFSNPGAEKVYRGVAVAQWTAEKIKDPVTAEVLANSICEKVATIDEGLYTTLITAKANPKTRQGKNDVMMCELDKMMKR